MSEEETPWPTEVRLSKSKDELTVKFDNGTDFALPAEMLRVMSPSAEVQGHSPAERKTVPGKRSVKINELNPVGNYALKILFDDGHSTGIYSWTYLHTLGTEKEKRWAEYLAELDEKGLKRD